MARVAERNPFFNSGGWFFWAANIKSAGPLGLPSLILIKICPATIAVTNKERPRMGFQEKTASSKLVPSESFHMLLKYSTKNRSVKETNPTIEPTIREATIAVILMVNPQSL